MARKTNQWLDENGVIVTDEGRTCLECLVFKPWAEFNAHSHTRNGHDTRCRACKSAYMKRRRKAKPELRLDQWGLTIEDEARMIVAQAGRCPICKREFHEFKRKPAVDHCHVTERIRGLLCSNCNLGLGYFEDDIERFEAAIGYLKTA